MTKPTRADFMTSAQRYDIAAVNPKMPRTHQNMLAATKVARPGKTASDRAVRSK